MAGAGSAEATAEELRELLQRALSQAIPTGPLRGLDCASALTFAPERFRQTRATQKSEPQMKVAAELAKVIKAIDGLRAVVDALPIEAGPAASRRTAAPMLALADAIIPARSTTAAPPEGTEARETAVPEELSWPFDVQALWKRKQAKAIRMLIMVWPFLTILLVAAPKLLVRLVGSLTRTTLQTGVGVVQEVSNAIDETLDLQTVDNVTANGNADYQVRQETMPRWLIFILGIVVSRKLS